MSENLKCVLDLLQNCIHNGHEVKKLCDGTPETLKSNELIRQFVEKINEETKALEKMKKKIFSMMDSNTQKDYDKLKDELQNMINSMDSISNENVNQVIEALMRSKTSKTMRKFADWENLVKDFKGDNVTKEFVNVLIDRNQKIIKCLNRVIDKLPILATANCNNEALPPTPKRNRKLFILSDDLQKTIALPDRRQMSKIGTVTIHSDGSAAQATSVSFEGQTLMPRRNISGFLLDDVSGIEVHLELREDFSSSTSDLIDLSSTTSKLEASLKLEGEPLENIEIFEISILDIPNEVIAVVENDQTGEREEVAVQIVAAEPNNEVHGRIVEIKSPTESQQGKLKL